MSAPEILDPAVFADPAACTETPFLGIPCSCTRCSIASSASLRVANSPMIMSAFLYARMLVAAARLCEETADAPHGSKFCRTWTLLMYTQFHWRLCYLVQNS